MNKTRKSALTLSKQTLRDLTQDESMLVAGAGHTSGSYHCGSAVTSGYGMCRYRTLLEPTERCDR